jgi:hypothetical protein
MRLHRLGYFLRTLEPSDVSGENPCAASFHTISPFEEMIALEQMTMLLKPCCPRTLAKAALIVQ